MAVGAYINLELKINLPEVEALNPDPLSERTTPLGYVVSFNGRGGAVVPAAADYTASQITNNSSVDGVYVSNALDWLLAYKVGGADVTAQTPYAVPVGGSVAGSLVDSDWLINSATMSRAGAMTIQTTTANNLVLGTNSVGWVTIQQDGSLIVDNDALFGRADNNDSIYLQGLDTGAALRTMQVNIASGLTNTANFTGVATYRFTSNTELYGDTQLGYVGENNTSAITYKFYRTGDSAQRTLTIQGSTSADNTVNISGVATLNITPAIDLSGILSSTSYIKVTRSAGTSAFFQGYATGDSVPRFSASAEGHLYWGAGGASALDTELYRSAANILRTPDTFIADTALIIAETSLVGSEKLRVNGDAVVDSQLLFAGSGITAPTAATAQVCNISGFGFAMSGVQCQIRSYNGSAMAQHLYAGYGHVQIGTQTAQYASETLGVNGSGYFAGGIAFAAGQSLQAAGAMTVQTTTANNLVLGTNSTARLTLADTLATLSTRLTGPSYHSNSPTNSMSSGFGVKQSSDSILSGFLTEASGSTANGGFYMNGTALTLRTGGVNILSMTSTAVTLGGSLIVNETSLIGSEKLRVNGGVYVDGGLQLAASQSISSVGILTLQSTGVMVLDSTNASAVAINGTGTGTYLYAYEDGTSAGWGTGSTLTGAQVYFARAAGTEASIGFQVNNGTSDIVAARITSGGSLLIGTTSLIGSEKLRVNGAGYFDGGLQLAASQSISAAGAMTVQTTTANSLVLGTNGANHYTITDGATNVTQSSTGLACASSIYAGSGYYIGWGSSAVSLTGTASTNIMTFRTNSAERMRLDNGGSLLINTTSLIGSEKIRVNGAGYFDGQIVTAADSIQINTSKTPSSASDTGTTGQVAWDADYVYVCTATDTWKRAAITTW